MEGMNVDVVRQIARDLQRQSSTLESVSRRVDSLVSEIQSQWRGPDATQFVTWWRNEHRPKVASLAQALEGLGLSALNNAHEQERASGSGEMSNGHHVAGSTNALGGGLSGLAESILESARQAVEAADRTHRRILAARSFVAKFEGTKIDYDGAYGAQCFDVFRQYSSTVVGVPRNANIATSSIHAFDIYQQYDTNGVATYYDRIPYGQGDPQPGDIIVYSGGSDGHVALVTDVRDGGYSILEQNYRDPRNPDYAGAVPAAVHDRKYDDSILGYLRPKSVQPV